MKKALFLALVAMMATGMSFAITGTYVPTSDVLGAHQNGGRGCAGCHTPHSGAAGSGQLTKVADITTGNEALWAQDVTPLWGQTITFGNEGGSTAFTSSTTWGNPEGKGLLMCLSCHDGNVTPVNMMTNQSYEQKMGILPKTYGANPIPTLLGNDGSIGGNYLNDHPVGANNPIDPKDWAGTGVTRVATAGSTVTTIVPGTYDDFTAVYDPAAMQALATDGTKFFPVCTTCHNQHSMNTFKVGKNDLTQLTGTFQTFFFVKGPYNPGAVTNATAGMSQASSATQFCRQCHFGDSNESMGALRGTIPTAF